MSACVCLAVALATPVLCHAGETIPKVIGSTGPTRSLLPYYARLSSKAESPARNVVPAARDLLPIRTPDMAPGTVRPQQIDAQSLDRPFFILGSDVRSREWLAAHRARLVQMQAVGLLVQAETVEDLQRIAELGEGVPIAPVPGGDVAKRFGLKHYPVLVSAGWVEQ
jgi:integrating conjugative element protein (TIGR03765 family)